MNQIPLPQDKVFSVTELNNLIKELLEGFPVIQLEGEISNYRPNSSGHLYFNLKDANSIISAVMFRGAAYSLGFVPKDGMKVHVTGKLSVYGPQGKYQIVISKMAVAGEGEILRMIEERKRFLAAEGLFDQTRKKRLPLFPNTIGVVTSPTGAALRDILQITKRRNKCISVVVLPSLVQGTEAAETIVRQIRNANRAKLCDVLIVGRGGGSLEDLLPFSEESVIRAIAESEIPVVSAVGHEIDWALSDYAADLRAPTPSAAAEIVVPELSKVMQALMQYSQTMHQYMQAKVEKIRLTVKSFDPQNLELKFRSIEQPLLQRFDDAKDDLFNNITEKIRDTRQKIDNCMTILENASPQTIFDRGYSMVREKQSGTIVRDAMTLSNGTELEIIPAKGRIQATVTGTEK